MPALTLSPQVFTILSTLVEERSGLHYGPAERELLAEKISPRAVERGFESLLDYYYFLRYDEGGEDELRVLIEQLVVHETYFFRELEPLQILIREFIAPRVRANGEATIWSVACSTGEEPLTLAMLLDAAGLLDSVQILATDLSARALSRARSGLYGRRSVRGTPPPELLQRYLRREGEGYIVDARLRDRIRWRVHNLVEPGANGSEAGGFDAILCRNVLIYFRDETTTAVVSRLAGRLRPDGVLLVGVAESLLRFGTSLFCEERRGAFFYRRTP